MILKETLREVVLSQKEAFGDLELGVEREIADKINTELQHALIISGIRRCGKSTLMHQLSKKIKRFNYLNFEDTRLTGFELSDFEKLDEIYKEEFGESTFYLFDEIQNITGWEIFVRSRLDKKKKFIITGSNASLLSKELGTRLTGRHVNVELFPFSFKENVLFKKREENVDEFEIYLKEGGFPEYLKYKDPEILRELFTDVIQRDIVARHSIRESKALNEMALYLLTNVGKEFSFNALKNIFALGSVNTVSSFISYLEDSYLIFTVPKFDYSLKKQMVNPKKVYSIDNGLCAANSVSFSENKGRMLENLAYIFLRRDNKQIFYFKSENNRECDFLVKEASKIKMAIQVCYELNEDNKGRELTGLTEALNKFDLKEGAILTFNQEDELVQNGKKIKVVPLWKWKRLGYKF